MKRNLIALVAVVAAITLSSFTTQRFTSYFLVYSGSNSQTAVGSYSSIIQGPTAPAHLGTGTGAQILNWLRAEDSNGTLSIQNDELATAFATYNTGGNSTLNDEVDDPGNLDIKDL